MKKKQTITSPNKISPKESNMVAKLGRLGPQEVILSDTSIKNHFQKNEPPIYSTNSREKLNMTKNKTNTSNKYSTGKTVTSPRNKTTTTEITQTKTNKINTPQENWQQFGEVYQSHFPPQADERGDEREGEHTFANGDIHIGLSNGRYIEGYGVYTFTTMGLQYRGNFKHSKQHGEGVLLRLPSINEKEEEIIYDGEWMNGEKEGHGIYYYYKDTYYDGNWVKNKKEGQGIYRSADGEYRGEWKEDKKYGQGVLTLKNGQKYEGIWENDQFYEGIIQYPNGDVYDGEFKHFKRDGYGTYTYANKSTYKGYWSNNMKDGTGQVKYYNGDIYYGNFVQNRRHGDECNYSWSSGQQILNGLFRDDVPVQGKIRLPAEGENQFNLNK